jgi:hypothetical protein
MPGRWEAGPCRYLESQVSVTLYLEYVVIFWLQETVEHITTDLDEMGCSNRAQLMKIDKD